MAITFSQLTQHVSEQQQVFIDALDALIKDSYEYNSDHIIQHGWVVEVSIPYTKKWQNANHDFIVDEYIKAGWKKVELSLPAAFFEMNDDPSECSYGKEIDGELKLSLYD